MNVLFVHERAAYFGGVEQNIADTVAGLRSLSISCHLAYGQQFPAQSAFLELFDSAHPCLEIGPTAGILPGARLSTILQRTNADCVYLHKLPHLPESLDTASVRTVQMVHDHDLCCPRRHKYTAATGKVCQQPAGWRCYLDAAFLVRDSSNPLGVRFDSIADKLHEMRRRRRLDAFLVASQFMRDELAMNGFPSGRINVLPIAVPTTAPPPVAAISKLPTVIYVGQLIRGKGVDLLLHSLAQVYTPFRCVIAGTGNAAPQLHRLAADLGIADRVRFLGWVPNHELPALYQLADVVAVPSRWPEPYGMVGLEAMRHARPVVAFAVGGIPDWLAHQQTGLLVPPADTAAFAKAIDQLLSNRSLARRMGADALQRFQQHYSFDSYVAGLARVLLPAFADLLVPQLQEEIA